MRTIKFRMWDGEKIHDWENVKEKPMQVFEYATKQNYMQFTGLLDKNGTEIYEGDIVKPKYGETTVVVEWREKECQFSIGGFGEWEVIGNIYENPELLNA